MSIIPVTKVEQLEFCESHWPVWLAQALNVGVSVVAVNQFKAKTESARAAYDAAQAAKQAWRAAVLAQNAELSDAVGDASNLIRSIKAFAETTGKPDDVYALAQIPAPAPPTPASAPGKPSNISVLLQSSGAITLSWEAVNAAASSGGFFSISRKLPGQSGFVVLDSTPGQTSASRRVTFTDATIPTSAAGAGAQYIIQGRRGVLFGEASDAVVVQFGVEGVSVTGAELKIAA